MLKRNRLYNQINTALQRSRCVALLGPRQCGKTTIARLIAKEAKSTFLDLEDPEDQARLTNPKMALEKLEGLVILDEIQLYPDLFPILRVLLDRTPLPAKFLILGSASPTLLQNSSETLAGRIEFIDMSGFSIEETGSGELLKRWVRGGFPLSFLAREEDSFAWRSNYIRTFLERDLRKIGVDLPPPTLRRFLLMLSHYHGQNWNASQLANSMDLTGPTVKKYLDIMTGAYMVRQLPPWFENLGKRLVRSPKIYIRDSGIFHYLADIKNMDALEANPAYGQSWEGFALEEILHRTGDENGYFWRTQAGAELDLLLMRGNRRIGFEFKCSESPKTSKSMAIAIKDLNLSHLYIVYPGKSTFPIKDTITALSLTDSIADKMWAELRG